MESEKITTLSLHSTLTFTSNIMYSSRQQSIANYTITCLNAGVPQLNVSTHYSLAHTSTCLRIQWTVSQQHRKLRYLQELLHFLVRHLQ